MKQESDLLNRFPHLLRLSLGQRRHRIPVVRQLATDDCGAAALAMALGYYGQAVPLNELRSALGIHGNGTDADAMLRTARAYGLRARGVRLDIADLEHLSCGAILHWEFRHYVVFDKARHGRIHIVDPAFGRRSVSLKDFRRAFTGVVLILEPTEAFEPSAAKPRRVFRVFRQVLERGDLLARIISSSILVQVLSLALPLLTGVLIDRVVPRRDYSLLLALTLGYCVFQLFNVIAGFVRAHLLIHLRTQLEAQFTLRFLDHLIELPYAYFQQHTSGDLMVRLSSNNSVREILTSTTLSAFLDGATAAFYLVLLLLKSGALTIAVTLLAATRFALMVAMRWRQKQFLGENLQNAARSSTAQVEMLAGMETLKAMGLEHQAAESWSNVFVDGLNISIKRGQLEAVFSALLGLLSTISTLVLMFYGAYLVLEGVFSLGTMMAFSAMAAGFLGPLNNLVSSGMQLQTLEVYLERLNDVMDTPPEQADCRVTPAGCLSGAVALECVSFRYGKQDSAVLKDLSFEIQPGMRVALVGRTGSGKSTLARLLAGLYDPTSGRILFDGRDLKTLDRRSVRRQLGIVTQEPQLFGGSIRRNIALSDPQAALDRVVHAARLACIHEDILAMPMGYDTLLADRGSSLSGGQRQRVTIARALFSEPKLLILDEATSQLDAVTEEAVNRNLHLLTCTQIVVTHRLSALRDTELILVLERGRIVELGTHDELLAADGAYGIFVRSQRDREHTGTNGH